MIIETIKLSVYQSTNIILDEHTQALLNGRVVRNFDIGGRVFVSDGRNIRVRLNPNATYRDQELTLTPPSTVVVDGHGTYESINKIVFSGSSMQLHSDEDPRQKENARRLAAQAQRLAEQESQLRQDLQDRQNAISQLEQRNRDAERQLDELRAAAESLKQQKTGLEQRNQAEQQQIDELRTTAESLRQQQTQLTAVNGNLASLTSQLTHVNQALSAAKENETALNQAVTSATQQNRIVDAAIKKLRADLEQAEAAFAALKQQEDRLIEELKKYSPAVLDDLRNAIDALETQLIAAHEQWLTLSGEKRVGETRLQEQQAANDQLTVEIAQQPEALRLLQEAHEELTRRLTETIHAQEMCSEERQQELRDQISEQEPIAQQLTEQYQALEQRSAELTRTIDELQQAKDAELLRLYPQLTQGLDEVMRIVNGMHAEMASLQATATQFNQHVLACAAQMEQLQEWYHVDQTPLQKLLSRLGSLSAAEHERLLHTLNPTSADRVLHLFTTAESTLTELDDLLRDVIQSAQRDEHFTTLKATTNEQYARQEMKN